MEISTWAFLYYALLNGLTTAAGDIILTTSPGDVLIGLTDTLTVNCTFTKDDHSDMTVFISLFISRRKNFNDTTANGDELASVNRYIPHVNIILPEFNSSSGTISPDGGVSYLELTWIYPTELQGGEYVCTAQGIDDVGHTVSISTQANVTARLPDINEIQTRIKELNETLTTIEHTLSGLHSNLSVNFHQLSDSQTKHDDHVNKTLTVIETFQNEARPLVGHMEPSQFYQFNLTYRNHTYRALREPFWGGTDAVALCELYGGAILEIDDLDEYMNVRDFLNGHPRLSAVFLAGRFVNNKWLKQYTDELMFDRINWLMPADIYVTNDCRILLKITDWFLQAMPCKDIQSVTPYKLVNAICESRT